MALPPRNDPQRDIEIAALWLAGYAALLLSLPVFFLGMLAGVGDRSFFLLLGQELLSIIAWMLPGALHLSLAILVHFRLFVSGAWYVTVLEELLLRIGQWFFGIFGAGTVILGVIFGGSGAIADVLLFGFGVACLILSLEGLHRLCSAVSDRIEKAECAMLRLRGGVRRGFDPLIGQPASQEAGSTANGDPYAPPTPR